MTGGLSNESVALNTRLNAEKMAKERVQELVKEANDLAEAFNKEEKQQEEVTQGIEAVREELKKLLEEWKKNTMQSITVPSMPETLKNIPNKISFLFYFIFCLYFFLCVKLIISIHTQKLIFFLYFKLSYSKFARDLQNTQTQNPNTQNIENPNLKLWVVLGAYV